MTDTPAAREATQLFALPALLDTAAERTGPIGTLILITDDEMRDILTHIAGAGDRVLFDRLHDRWMSLRYGLDLPLTLEGTDR